ncbi:hypothetical protein SUGI_1160200 [Cryptomeria japonica]|nr:NAC domain-containing protein 76 isoform X2 [Cryptomeria japonica]XP_057863444.2 NAC domain-containing protein 76 isoform X2 [Cryptomeria japonica]XP_057863446.2 NAC domain-containing protein 76 isoform X2 [Cryptomeria japonica]XP_057863447.2 NAC domain-containing protein 76 isoform X2 [Cryptomeria japonica]XP_057863448.2 NAC domain-containing protein 76 isoform X2 [Cryptomeria japonica]XP_057863449.2 NAC domain-containing protein 76 isoform X2 [Cryptomeria japonica]XP_057863450.2 NAC doma
MTLSVNGQSRVPPGFRFHPTEEELLYYYLKKKVSFEKIDLDVIRDVDLNKLEPWDIQERCKIGSTPQNDWYFFSHKDKKYPTGTRTNRATAAGFWKATGRDKAIHMDFKRIGMRKTLVFYRGRAPHGQKTDWIMHEYRLDDNENSQANAFNELQEDGWVVCRVFKKRNHFKGNESPPPNLSKNKFVPDIECLNSGPSAAEQMHYTATEQANMCMKQELDIQYGFSTQDQFMQLPHLESPKFPCPVAPPPPPPSSSGMKRLFPDRVAENISKRSCYPPPMSLDMTELDGSTTSSDQLRSEAVQNLNLNDWTVLDRLVASHLNQEEPPCKEIRYGAHAPAEASVALPQLRMNKLNPHDFGCEIDLWNFGK